MPLLKDVKCSHWRSYYFSNDSALWRASILYHSYLTVTAESVKSNRENWTGSFFKLHLLHFRLLWPSTFLQSTTAMHDYDCNIPNSNFPSPIAYLTRKKKTFSFHSSFKERDFQQKEIALSRFPCTCMDINVERGLTGGWSDSKNFLCQLKQSSVAESQEGRKKKSVQINMRKRERAKDCSLRPQSYEIKTFH